MDNIECQVSHGMTCGLNCQSPGDNFHLIQQQVFTWVHQASVSNIGSNFRSKGFLLVSTLFHTLIHFLRKKNSTNLKSLSTYWRIQNDHCSNELTVFVMVRPSKVHLKLSSNALRHHYCLVKVFPAGECIRNVLPRLLKQSLLNIRFA